MFHLGLPGICIYISSEKSEEHLKTMEKHVSWPKRGSYARCWTFEKGNRRRIARSSDLDYSQAPEPQNPIFKIGCYRFPGFGGLGTPKNLKVVFT